MTRTRSNAPRRLAMLALLCAMPALHAASLRAITDVWGGSGNGSIAQGCTTFGPIPDLGTFFGGGGFRVSGGNVACGYTGVTFDQTVATGTLLSQQTLPTVALDNAGSTYSGAAGARAAYGSLGVAASGLFAGSTGGTTATVATGAAFFSDTLTASSPLLAPASPGYVRYVFAVDGRLSSSAVSNGEASLQLSLRHAAGPIYTLGRLGAFGGSTGTYSAIDGDRSGWTLGPGSVSGAGLFGSTIHVPFSGDVDLPMNWSMPFDFQVGLQALTNRTADASFMASARLVDIQFFDAAHQRVTGFTLSSASGTDYLAAVPEPGAAALLAAGLGMLAAWRRRTSLAARGPVAAGVGLARA